MDKLAWVMANCRFAKEMMALAGELDPIIQKLTSEVVNELRELENTLGVVDDSSITRLIKKVLEKELEPVVEMNVREQFVPRPKGQAAVPPMATRGRPNTPDWRMKPFAR
jgi:hypothetical protein